MRLGLGCMRLSTAGRPPEDEAVAVVHAALDAGVRLLDTANVYALDGADMGHNERLVRRALDTWSGDAATVRVATKGGLTRPGKRWAPAGKAKALRAACEASVEALGGPIDLYQLHAVDPRTKLETSVRALARAQRDGLVRQVGLCNVRLDELRRARDLVDVGAVQVALSPVDVAALRGGVAEYCLTEGIELLAHSPLGGHRSVKKLKKHPALREVAARHGATPAEVALAWLLDLAPDLVPLPGATRVESVASCARAASLALDEADREVLDAALPAGRILRIPRHRRRPADPEGDVVLLMGYPGGGKTTAVTPFVDAGYLRLNRDTTGGTLAGVAARLDQALAAGARRVVLDNTYPTRATRNRVVETAWAHGVAARCVWVTTGLEDAQVNACQRMIERYGRLLTPEEMAAARDDPNSFPPRVQHRYRDQLEPPEVGEGFEAVEAVPFERAPAEGTARALLLSCDDGVLRTTRSGRPRPVDADDVVPVPGRAERLRQARHDGWLLAAISWTPEAADPEAIAARTTELLGLDLVHRHCPHPAGPPICWCRKPLPGLGVALIRELGLDPAACLVVGRGAADKGFAARLGIPFEDAVAFFGGSG